MGTEAKLIKILLVEDDEIDILSTISVFRKLISPVVDFHFDIAKNGIEALDKLYGRNGETKISPPSVILLDISMPKMDGVAFLTELRMESSFNNISVYLLTGLYSTKDKISTQDLGLKGRIIKPIQEEDALRIFLDSINLSL